MEKAKPSPLKAEYRLLAALGFGLFFLCLGATSYVDLTILAQRPWRSELKIAYFTGILLSAISLLLSLSIFLRRGSWPRYMARITWLAAAQFSCFGLQLIGDSHLPNLLFFITLSLLYAIPFGICLHLRFLPVSLPSNLDRLLLGVGLSLTLAVLYNSYQSYKDFGAEAMLWSSGLSLSLLTLCSPLVTVGLQIYHHRTKIQFDRRWETWKLSPWSASHTFEALFLTALLGNAFVSLIFATLARDSIAAHSDRTTLLWANFHLGPVFIFCWSLRTWYLVSRIPRRFHTPYLMEKARAGQLFRRFWIRSNPDYRHHIGYRTAVLILDHDPHEDYRTQLPSFLYRSRQTQCEQIIKGTFQDTILSMESHASQITLALDNSQQSIPCTHALLILSILHLDGLRLIESRLRLLARLFPLLDPELADHVDQTRLDQLFAKPSSFFYLDYNWIDQTLFALGDDAYLDIRLEKLNGRERQNVLEQLRSAQWLGNFVWISESAFERLSLESPFISPIVESVNVRLDTIRHKKNNYTIYLLKFESLIPRLQRYFDLEIFRNKIASFPIEAQTLQLLTNLRSSLEFDGGMSTLHYALQEIEQHDFVGFKAKDAALEILLQIAKKAEALYLAKRLNEQELEQIFQQCKSLVQSTGYPSQDLHQSHLRKLEIREYQQLLVYGRDSQHPRCHEAWLFLASLPEKKLEGDFGRRAAELIRAVIESPVLNSQSFIIRKAVETFFVLARAQREHSSVWRSLLDPLARLIIRDPRKHPLIQSFMDQKIALDQSLGEILPLAKDTITRWETYIQDFTRDPDCEESQKQTLELRWRSFSQGQKMKLVS